MRIIIINEKTIGLFFGCGMLLVLLGAVFPWRVGRDVNSTIPIWRANIIKEVDTKEKMIALTFDDGPSPSFTGRILDILKQYNAKATFFLIGEQAEKMPALVKR